MQSLSEIRKIVRFCRKNGILRYKDGEFEINLKDMPLQTPGPEIQTNLVPEFPSWDSLTPEQKLLWSATTDQVGA